MSNQKQTRSTFQDLQDALSTQRFAKLEVERVMKDAIREGDEVRWTHGHYERIGLVIWRGYQRLRVTAKSKSGYQFVEISRVTRIRSIS